MCLKTGTELLDLFPLMWNDELVRELFMPNE